MTPEQILTKAAELVSGERATQHGDYVAQFERTAELWSVYLKVEVTAQQVAFCNALQKVSRDEVGAYNEDDGYDAAAYTGLAGAFSYLRSKVPGKTDA